MNIKEFLTGYKGKDIPKELKAFNWGAYIFTFIWGIKYKAWITLLAIPFMVFQLPLGLNWLLFAVLQIYCGIKGNDWAYQVEWWKSPAEYRRTQLKWAVCAMLLTLLCPLVAGILAVKFAKNPDNLKDFVRNSQCVTANNKVKKGIVRVSVTSTPNEMAQKFSTRFKNTRVEGNKVIFTNGKNESYYIMFDKMDNDAACDVSKNCFITSNYELPDMMILPFDACTFYFDNNKNVIPDKSTSEALQKGANIFKYL